MNLEKATEVLKALLNKEDGYDYSIQEKNALTYFISLAERMTEEKIATIMGEFNVEPVESFLVEAKVLLHYLTGKDKI